MIGFVHADTDNSPISFSFIYSEGQNQLHQIFGGRKKCNDVHQEPTKGFDLWANEWERAIESLEASEYPWLLLSKCWWVIQLWAYLYIELHLQLRLSFFLFLSRYWRDLERRKECLILQAFNWPQLEMFCRSMWQILRKSVWKLFKSTKQHQ